MDIATLTSTIRFLPADISVLVRGPHGIGKSQVAAQLAEDEGKTLIDRRLSQMSEGDMVGLPELVDGVTRFCPPDWYARACREPVVLFMDELNRATPEVIQAAFQIVLDRELNGHKLHPDTRVFAAVNVGAEYEVNEMDPALLRRFWVADLEPAVGDWIDWATGAGLDSILVEFIQQNPEHWKVCPSSVEPGTVVPTPASWHRLDETFQSMMMAPSALAGNTTPAHFYSVAMGFVGTEAAISFCDFVKNYERQISADDVLEGKVKANDIKDLPASTTTSVIDKLGNHSKDNEWSKKQVKNVAEFAKELGGEMLIATFTAIQKANNLKNLIAINKLIGQEVVSLVNNARSKK